MSNSGICHKRRLLNNKDHTSKNVLIIICLKILTNLILAAIEVDDILLSSLTGVDGRVVTSSESTTAPGDIGSGVLQPLLASARLSCRRLRLRPPVAFAPADLLRGSCQRFRSSISAFACRISKKISDSSSSKPDWTDGAEGGCATGWGVAVRKDKCYNIL